MSTSVPGSPAGTVSGSPARSLAEHLRGWTDEQLVALVKARPDVAVPPPRDSGQLAGRLGTRHSLLRVLDRLTTRELAVLAAISRTAAVSAADLAQQLGLPPAETDASVANLLGLAVIWPSDAGLRALPDLRRVLAGADDLDAAAPPPILATAPADQERADRSGAATAGEVVRRVELLLDRWGHQPPVALRSTGLSVRDLKAAATLLHTSPDEAALLIEVAAQARLLTLGATDTSVGWMPTGEFDRWIAEDLATRWTVLAQAWLDSARLAHLIGTRDSSGKTINALASDLQSVVHLATREATLAALGELAPGDGLAVGTGLPSLVGLLTWRRPRLPAESTRSVVATVEEATTLGLFAAGTLTSSARALLSGDTPRANATMAALLPAPVAHVLLQADLTAVAPGPLTTETNRDLHQVADLESRGGAGVFRFSSASLRRAFDHGWTAHEIHALLARIAATSVPQPLSYLVDDVARSFGTLRVGYAESFIRSDDEAALARLVADKRAARWGLRLLAPTVVVSTSPIETLLPRLRELGLAPVIESADGSVRVARSDAFRARSPAPQRGTTAQDDARAAARAVQVVAALRVGDRAAITRGRPPAVATPGDVLDILRNAVETGSAVWMEYVDQHGQVSERLVDPDRITSGAMVGFDQRAQAPRTFLLHRIRGIALAAS